MGVVSCVEVAEELLSVETGVAIISFRRASRVLICAAYVAGIAEENHGGRVGPSRASYTRLLASPVTEAAEAADATDSARSLSTAGGMYVEIRD